MAGTVELNIEAELRKWCLERAFELRALTKVNHMQVTNVAEEYYRWIVYGESQGNQLNAQMKSPKGDERSPRAAPFA